MDASVFESAFCRVEYREEDGAVLVAWKQFCRLEDYRRPTSFALELLRAHPGSVFIIERQTALRTIRRMWSGGFPSCCRSWRRRGCAGLRSF